MASVSTTGAAIYRTGAASGPNLGGNWAFKLWLKVDSYAGGAGTANLWRHSLESITAHFDINTAATGQLVAQWYQDSNTLTDTVVLETGSFTGWICIAASHVSAEGTISVYWRLEGESAWTSDTLSAPGLTAGPTFGGGADSTALYVLCDGVAASVHFRSLKTWAAARSDSALLAESALLDSLDDATGIYAFLDLDDATTGLTTDLSGAGHDFSVFGDYSTDAGETPDAALDEPQDQPLRRVRAHEGVEPEQRVARRLPVPLPSGVATSQLPRARRRVRLDAAPLVEPVARRRLPVQTMLPVDAPPLGVWVPAEEPAPDLEIPRRRRGPVGSGAAQQATLPPARLAEVRDEPVPEDAVRRRRRAPESVDTLLPRARRSSASELLEERIARRLLAPPSSVDSAQPRRLRSLVEESPPDERATRREGVLVPPPVGDTPLLRVRRSLPDQPPPDEPKPRHGGVQPPPPIAGDQPPTKRRPRAIEEPGPDPRLATRGAIPLPAGVVAEAFVFRRRGTPDEALVDELAPRALERFAESVDEPPPPRARAATDAVLEEPVQRRALRIPEFVAEVVPLRPRRRAPEDLGIAEALPRRRAFQPPPPLPGDPPPIKARPRAFEEPAPEPLPMVRGRLPLPSGEAQFFTPGAIDRRGLLQPRIRVGVLRPR